MENIELLKTIEQLKETLSDVATARDQVNETVKAYSKTQTEIHFYIENLNQIESAISSLISMLQNNKIIVEQQSINAVDNLKASCDVILNQAKSEFVATSLRFSDETGRSVNSLTTQIERFDHSIDKANTLTNKVEATSKEVSGLIASVKSLQVDIVNSQKTQDEANEHIREMLSDAKVSLSKQDEVLSQNAHNLDSIVESISSCTVSLTEKLSKVSSEITVSFSSVDKSIEDLKSLQDKHCSNVLKEINTNRWIIIATLIILVVLQFLFK